MPKAKKKQSNQAFRGLLLALDNDPVYLKPLVPVTGKVLDHVINGAAGVDIPRKKEEK